MAEDDPKQSPQTQQLTGGCSVARNGESVQMTSVCTVIPPPPPPKKK